MSTTGQQHGRTILLRLVRKIGLISSIISKRSLFVVFIRVFADDEHG